MGYAGSGRDLVDRDTLSGIILAVWLDFSWKNGSFQTMFVQIAAHKKTAHKGRFFIR